MKENGIEAVWTGYEEEWWIVNGDANVNTIEEWHKDQWRVRRLYEGITLNGGLRWPTPGIWQTGRRREDQSLVIGCAFEPLPRITETLTAGVGYWNVRDEKTDYAYKIRKTIRWTKLHAIPWADLRYRLAIRPEKLPDGTHVSLPAPVLNRRRFPVRFRLFWFRNSVWRCVVFPVVSSQPTGRLGMNSAVLVPVVIAVRIVRMRPCGIPGRRRYFGTVIGDVWKKQKQVCYNNIYSDNSFRVRCSNKKNNKKQVLLFTETNPEKRTNLNK